jgi:arsenite oxidase small subunit
VKRRAFLGSCALIPGAASLVALAQSDAPAKLYGRTRLIDIHGQPLRAKAVPVETNFVFHYPYAATPCFLLKLPRATAAEATLTREDGKRYAWSGGVGPERALVAFSAICAHKLAYPTREVSFIRYQKERSATSDGAVIHCCADHSVYDPSRGARVVSGPAPQPLAAIVLEHDAARDELFAVGTVGPEQFDAFFAKYEIKLGFEYGPGKARVPVGSTSVVREMASYCKTTISC